MLQLTRCIGLGVNIADFFHLKASLKGNRVVDTSADEKDVMRIGILGSEPLDSLLILKQSLDLSGEGPYLCQHLLCFRIIYHSADERELDGENVGRDQLRGISLCRRDGYFRACHRIQNIISLAGNGGSHYINYSQRFISQILRFAKSCEGICRFSRLADNNDKIIRSQKRSSVSELGSQLHAYRNADKILKYILGCYTHMICTAASDDRETAY